MRLIPTAAVLTVLIFGCSSKTPMLVHQQYSDCEVSERSPSIFNTVVVVSCLPSNPGAQLFVSSGTSLATAAVVGAQIAGGVTPLLEKQQAEAPMPIKGILNVDDWTSSFVTKLQAALPAMLTDLDGYSFVITNPALSQPIVITIHRPKSGNEQVRK